MANKTYQGNRCFYSKASAFAVASCLALFALPASVHAAGLGRLAVFSALGQPLRAEIEVTATREELADMKARLASPEMFKQAGLDYATTLLSIRFSLEKRPDGKAVIKLSSDRPINDPFVDMLMELDWSSGRLIREYSFLLDPPEYQPKSASLSVEPPTVGGGAVRRPASQLPVTSSRIESDIRTRALARVNASPMSASAQKTEGKPFEGGSREVRKGETLHRIASEVKPQGVTLDQMLVGIFRANPDAFEGGNMNRLRSGQILSIPDRSTLESVDPAEARKIVLAQSSEWKAYRNKLAGISARSPAKADAGQQESGGKITAKVEEKEESAASRDQLKVSRTQSPAKPAAAGKASDEDVIAREKALREANERIAALEKSVADLQKLLELKNQSLAEMQKSASSSTEKGVRAVQPVSAGSSTEPPARAESLSGAEKSSPSGSVSEPAAAAGKPAGAQPPVQPPEAVVEPKPATPKPVRKPAAPTPAPRVEPGFFETWLGEPMMLAGSGGVLALLAALFITRRKRSSKKEPEADLSSTLTPPSTAGWTANSVFRTTGGQSVDTASQTPVQTDFSQAGPGSIDTDEVDPVAEADVYMAYGRDAQAEEILLEAKQKDPKRLAIHLKLLEIYSARKDLKRFETLATELYGETGGVGPEWDKALAMGRLLDPENPMFRKEKSVPETRTIVGEGVSSDSPAVQKDDLRGLSSQTLRAMEGTGAEIDFGNEGAQSLSGSPMPTPTEPSDTAHIDFDFGEAAHKPAQSSVISSPESEVSDALGALDFDLTSTVPEAPLVPDGTQVAPLDMPPSEPAIESASSEVDAAPPLNPGVSAQAAPASGISPDDVHLPAKEDFPDLDFDLGVPDTGLGQQMPAKEAATAIEGGAGDIEFDVNLTESTFLGHGEPPSFDLSEIDLDLLSSEPATAVASTKASLSTEMQAMSSAEDVDASETAQASTAVNPDFSVEQAETLIVPGASGDQSGTVLNPELLDRGAETVVVPALDATADLAPVLETGGNEEAATKLDLAKAYEEMGDLEGARELLHEVLKEGDATQRETAQNLLGRIDR